MNRTHHHAAVLALTSIVAFAPTVLAQGLVAPVLVDEVQAPYPTEKVGSGESAKVVLLLVVDATGKVTEATVTSSGGKAFDDAALGAAKALVFKPATKDGKPIPAKIPFTFQFAPPAPKAVVVEKGALHGSVRTPVDDPLTGAKVTAKSDAETRTATTGTDGKFRFDDLLPGKYRVEVQIDGFLPFAVDEEVTAKMVTDVVYRPELPPPPKLPGKSGGPIELVVKGEKPPREVTKHEISGTEILKVPGTNGDPLRAIENLPGVARPPSVLGLLIVRGSAPEDTGVFIDGTQIPIAYHFGGLTSVVPGELLEKIDFYPGNFGLQYGRGMGGIVDIGLRSPRKDGLHGVVKLDLLDGRLVFETPLGERTRILIGVRRSWIDTWLKPVLESTGTGVSTAPVYYDGQVVLEHDLTEKTTGRLAFFGSSDRLAITLNAPDPNDPIAGDFGLTTEFWRVQARTETKLPKGGRWLNMLSYGLDKQNFSLGANYFRLSTRPLNLRSDLRARLVPGLDGIVGLDWQWQRADIALDLPPIPREGEAPSPFFSRPSTVFSQTSTVYQPGVYFGFDLSPLPGIRLVPGLRVDYTKETKSWNVSPRAVVRWDVTRAPRTTLKGGAGLFQQPPQPYQSLAPYGTEGLVSNRAMHYSAGIEHEFNAWLDVSFEGFFKDLRNLVTQSDAADQKASGAAFANTGSGRVYGTELLLRWKNDGRFFGWLAYTLSRSERRDAPGEPLRVFQYDQTHIFTALASYKIGKGWEIGGRFRYVTGSPYTPYVGGIADYDAGSYAAIPGALYSARDAAFHRLDLRVEKTWTVGSGNVSAYLDVQNVYNRQNPEGQQYNYRYSQSQPVKGLPILPILGVRGEL